MSFLLSDATVEYGNQFLCAVTGTGSSCHVMAFVKDFEKLPDLQRKFPDVIWIVIDINRRSDTVANFLKVIPTPNYILNFDGPEFSQTSLGVFQRYGITFKVRERGRSELTLEGIVDEDDGKECRILVNVVEKRSTLKKKGGKLVKGTKKKLNSLLAQDDDVETSEENVPLLGANSANNRVGSDQEPTGQGFIDFLISIFSVCCPCLFTPKDQVYCFRNKQDLRLQMHSEQLDELGNAFKKLHATSISRWNQTQVELEKNKSQQIEELVARIDNQRQQEERDLTALKERQNANTRDRLSNVLTENVIKREEASRARQTKATVKYNADRAYREGESRILNQIAIDKAQRVERHYFKLVEDQLQKLSDIQLQFQRKTSRLEDKYFKNQT